MAERTRRGCPLHVEAKPQKSAPRCVDNFPFPVGLPPPPTNRFPGKITMACAARGGGKTKNKGDASLISLNSLMNAPTTFV
jgi:hypothetical protein